MFTESQKFTFDFMGAGERFMNFLQWHCYFNFNKSTNNVVLQKFLH